MKTIIVLTLCLTLPGIFVAWRTLSRGVYRVSAGKRVFKVKLILPPGDQYYMGPLSVDDRERLSASLATLHSGSPTRFRVTTRKYDFTKMIFDVEIISVNG